MRPKMGECWSLLPVMLVMHPGVVMVLQREEV
jgi:hypothetical protein